MSHTSKFQIAALSLTLMAALSSRGQAQSASPSPLTAKVGIVNSQQVIFECNEGKKEIEALQAKFDPKQAELKKLSDEVGNLRKAYDAQKGTLNAEKGASQLKAIEAKQKTMERNFAEAQNELQRAEQEVVNRIGVKMMKVLEKYAKAHGYTLVLDVASPQTPVLWSEQRMIITKELIAAYNAENPAAAQAPAKVFQMPSGPSPKLANPALNPKKP
jgi:outer membrane protein